MSDSVRPHRQQSTTLPHPWDSPGKNTGVGCHFLLQCMKVKSESQVVQSCPTPRDPMNCSLPGSSVHGIFQARVLEWGAIAGRLQSMGFKSWTWLSAKRTHPRHTFQRLAIPLQMFFKTEDPLTLLPNCFSLSILPFDFSSSLLFYDL